MNRKTARIPGIISFLSGFATLATFIFLNGIAFGWLADAGYYSFIYSSFFSLTENKILRFLFFITTQRLQDYLMLFFIMIIFVYFPVMRTNEKTTKYIILSTFGAITADYVLFILFNNSLPFDAEHSFFTYSMIFTHPIPAIISNILAWSIICWFAIRIIQRVTTKQQDATKPSSLN